MTLSQKTIPHNFLCVTSAGFDADPDRVDAGS
jgi:hypothetical protein